MRLRRSDPWKPGLRRRRRGRGFQYVDATGTAVTGGAVTDEETLNRIRALAIPPAWRDVWICPHPNGHIQAVGIDAAGRRQYLYHERWRRERDADKHDRVLELAELLPSWRERIHHDLRATKLGRSRVLASALFMLDRGVFRTGNERYTDDNGSYGVATLLREHAHVRRGECFFRYLAKGGIERAVSIRDAALAAVVGALLRCPAGGDRLLRYRDSAGWHDVTAAEINDAFKGMVGEEFTVKDLRTWNATVLAATALATAPPATSKTAASRAVAAAMREVAEGLGNTPAVARDSYVDPRVIHCYETGVTIALAPSRNDSHPETARAAIEKATIAMLNDMR